MNDWQPDLETIEWGLASVHEPDIGESIIRQLRQRFPEIATIDPSLLGEAAVETVLFTMIANRDDPHGKPVFGQNLTGMPGPCTGDS